MASPTLDSRNLHRIGSQLEFLEDTLVLQPESNPEHLRAWVVWLCDMDKQWASLPLSSTHLIFPDFCPPLGAERVPWHTEERRFSGGTDWRAPREREEGLGP